MYEYGDASVLVKNDVAGNGIPRVNMQTIEHVFDVSYAVDKQVQIISGYRTDSISHRQHNAIDVRISGYSSEQVANALHGSNHFKRVASYTDDRASAHADYMPSSHSRYQGRYSDQEWYRVHK